MSASEPTPALARRGDTHLNDVTLVHPIFDEDGNILVKILQSDHAYGVKCAVRPRSGSIGAS